MKELFLVIGGIYGCLAVIFGAFGAHALKKKLSEEQQKSFEKKNIKRKKNSMTQSLILGKKNVGFGKPIYFVAEIGINHNGRIGLALKMVKRSKMAGFDAVKFQKRDIKDLLNFSFHHCIRKLSQSRF